MPQPAGGTGATSLPWAGVTCVTHQAAPCATSPRLTLSPPSPPEWALLSPAPHPSPSATSFGGHLPELGKGGGGGGQTAPALERERCPPTAGDMGVPWLGGCSRDIWGGHTPHGGTAEPFLGGGHISGVQTWLPWSPSQTWHRGGGVEPDSQALHFADLVLGYTGLVLGYTGLILGHAGLPFGGPRPQSWKMLMGG